MLVIGLIGLFHEVAACARQCVVPQHALPQLDLSVCALRRYTAFSRMRGAAAYVLSLAFSLVYGYRAAHDARAARVLLPLLDIL